MRNPTAPRLIRRTFFSREAHRGTFAAGVARARCRFANASRTCTLPRGGPYFVWGFCLAAACP
jgi:hypothetical protein